MHMPVIECNGLWCAPSNIKTPDVRRTVDHVEVHLALGSSNEAGLRTHLWFSRLVSDCKRLAWY